MLPHEFGSKLANALCVITCRGKHSDFVEALRLFAFAHSLHSLGGAHLAHRLANFDAPGRPAPRVPALAGALRKTLGSGFRVSGGVVGQVDVTRIRRIRRAKKEAA